ncbi:hypothetical protein OMCYN_00716 [cyanobiont of Ornithocercus magnificus]|nr:hypothetical protein OMCYN_00716 [cyanobiont of Ornithocercus magnificus]
MSSKKDKLLTSAASLYGQARNEAETGDVSAAGTLILRALECERRAGEVGPQVMQLIKPRS